MPEGVSVLVEDGSATIDFVDPAKRGPGLGALVAAGGPNAVEKLSHSGPRIRYRVREDVAKAAGLLDKASRVDALEAPDTGSAGNASGATPPDAPSTRDLHAQTMRAGSYASEYGEVVIDGQTFTGVLPVSAGAESAATAEVSNGYDDGEPDADWSRAQLNAAAAEAGVAHPEKLPNKPAVLDAYRKAKAKAAATS